MDADETVKLPHGVSVRSRDEGGYELRIVAPDADELIWRLHDVVTMIQTGQFEAYLDGLDAPPPPDDPPSR